MLRIFLISKDYKKINESPRSRAEKVSKLIFLFSLHSVAEALERRRQAAEY